MAHTLASLAARLSRHGALRQATARLAAGTPTGVLVAGEAAMQGAKFTLIGAGALAAGGGAAVAAIYAAGRQALPEEYGGRTRWMPPAPLAWAWPEKYGRGVLSTEGLFELVPGLRQQWEATGRQHVPMPPGECKVTFVEPAAEEGGLVLGDAVREMVATAARAAAAAAAQEAEHTGVGKRLQDWGVTVFVTPSRADRALCMVDGTICITAGAVKHLAEHASSEEEVCAALLWTLLHELGHAAHDHELEDRAIGRGAYPAINAWWVDGGDDATRAEQHMATASRVQEAVWAHEYEADAFATAACLALRVRPEHLAASMRASQRSYRAAAQATAQSWEEDLRSGRSSRAASAAVLGCPPAAVEAELRRLRDPDAFLRLGLRLSVLDLLPKAADERSQGSAPHAAAAAAASPAEPAATSTATAEPGAAQGGPSQQLFLGWPVVGTAGPAIITTHVVETCPEPARQAVLMALADTHPRDADRIARIEAAARAPALQGRRTAPTVPVGGVYSYGRSVAEQLAEQLEARQRREAAVHAGRVLPALQKAMERMLRH